MLYTGYFRLFRLISPLKLWTRLALHFSSPLQLAFMMMSTASFYCLIGVIAIHIAALLAVNTDYNVGAGLWDITGPAAEINMMGYAKGSQSSNGIHIRQFSRAFVISDAQNKGEVVFVSIDACMVSTLVKMQVVKKLQTTYGTRFDEKNVAISGIHTHSGPGGFHQYVLLDITSMGFVRQSMDALVQGIYQSIVLAVKNVKPANLYLNSGELVGANINRSPTAYANNPKDEKARYQHNTDTEMTVLKITDEKNYDVGMISWFPVHCTSMNNTNGLISGDNKGYAAQMFERSMNDPKLLPHQVKFIAAFAQANEGDVSPNTNGPHCLDTGLACDNPHSTCNGKNENCVASGPGKDMFESTSIIGGKQLQVAEHLYRSANITGMKLSGPVSFVHQHVDMTNFQFPLANGTKVKTCPPAMGYSFAAGTTDGPGDFDFTQGTNSTNKFWNLVSSFISKPTPEQVACQAPKPILLNTGEVNIPYAWQPAIIPLQLLRVGQMVITSLPGEFTTMSGRRVRDSIKQTLLSNGADKNTTVVLAGLTNVYADYITTYEEYQVQRYEGASTIYGPRSLEAYIYLFNQLAVAMVKGTPVAPGPNPPDLLSKQLSFVLPVVYDSTPFGTHFGDPVTQPEDQYAAGGSVSLRFVSADPRNSLMTMESFMTVEKYDGSQWTVVFTDAHWETIFKWVRTNSIMGRSEAEITWDIPADQEAGTYRIRHSGYYKPFIQSPKSFTGTTKSFKVVAKESVNDQPDLKSVLDVFSPKE